MDGCGCIFYTNEDEKRECETLLEILNKLREDGIVEEYIRSSKAGGSYVPKFLRYEYNFRWVNIPEDALKNWYKEIVNNSDMLVLVGSGGKKVFDMLEAEDDKDVRVAYAPIKRVRSLDGRYEGFVNAMTSEPYRGELYMLRGDESSEINDDCIAGSIALMDDVIYSGATVEKLSKFIKERNPVKEVYCCALLDIDMEDKRIDGETFVIYKVKEKNRDITYLAFDLIKEIKEILKDIGIMYE